MFEKKKLERLWSTYDGCSRQGCAVNASGISGQRAYSGLLLSAGAEKTMIAVSSIY